MRRRQRLQQAARSRIQRSPGTDLERAQCDSIRLKLLKIGAPIKVTARKAWVSLAESYSYRRIFERVYEDLARGPGGKMNLTILRGNQQIPVPVTIGRCPESVAREGNVRVVTENRYKAVARFPKWWSKYFLPPSAQGPFPIDADSPPRTPPLR